MPLTLKKILYLLALSLHVVLLHSMIALSYIVKMQLWASLLGKLLRWDVPDLQNSKIFRILSPFLFFLLSLFVLSFFPSFLLSQPPVSEFSVQIDGWTSHLKNQIRVTAHRKSKNKNRRSGMCYFQGHPTSTKHASQVT